MYGLCSSLATPSSILSLQAPSFSLHLKIPWSSELQAPGLGAGDGSSRLETGVWSLQPHPGGFFLGGCRGDHRVSSRGSLPFWRSPQRLSSAILPRLGALVRHLALSWLFLAQCRAMLGQLGAILEQLGDKMMPKSAKMSQDGAQERQDEAR